jgi:hypothetical protein
MLPARKEGRKEERQERAKKDKKGVREEGWPLFKLFTFSQVDEKNNNTMNIPAPLPPSPLPKTPANQYKVCVVGGRTGCGE